MTAATEHENAQHGENPDAEPSTGAVYVMSNQDTGNSVTVFHRAADGSLTRKGTYPTGGLGTGTSTNFNAAVDPLGSQGALTLSSDRRFLFAVKAGSNEVSVLAIHGETLTLADRVPSGGAGPVSVTSHEDLLYVVNAADGTIAGFTVGTDGKLSPIAGSAQTLIGGAGAGPAQIQFNPDGTLLVVTEAANPNPVIDVFPVDENGRAGAPVKNDSSGNGPFAVGFHGQDILLVTEVNSGSVSTYRVAGNGTLKVISASVPTTELAPCWSVNDAIDPGVAYVANLASGSISGFRFDDTGAITPVSADGHAAVLRESHAAQDMALSSDGRFLYVLTGGFNFALTSPQSPTFVDGTPYCGKMSISAFRVETRDGLTPIGGYGVGDDHPVVNPQTGAVTGYIGGLSAGHQGLAAI